MVSQEQILDAGLIGRLEKYKLMRYRPVPKGYTGARLSRQKGGAVEFFDYRDYAAGDELKRVDWKAYARLGRLYVKEYQDEQQDVVLFLVDTSASMDWGIEKQHKGRFAQGLAAGLAVCALSGGDSAAAVAGSVISSVGAKQLNTTEIADVSAVAKPDAAAAGLTHRVFPARSGKQGLPMLWHWLDQINFVGVTDLVGCLQAGVFAVPYATSLYVISDLMVADGVEQMLQLAVSRGLSITLLHVLAPGELDPAGDGEWTMVDMETGAWVEVSLTPTVLREYNQRLADYQGVLDQSCRRWGARRVLLSTGVTLEETFLRTLPSHGILNVTTI